MARKERVLSEQEKRNKQLKDLVMNKEIVDEQERLKQFKHLLDCGAETTFEDKFKQDILFLVAHYGQKEICALLLERGDDVNNKDYVNDYTPLHYAAEGNHVEMCRFLLDHGAKIDEKCKLSWTPLYILASQNSADACRILLEYGASVHEKDKDGKTPLYPAASKGRIEICDLLLSYGANVNERDNFGQTALYEAVRWCQIDTCHFLLKHGAKIDNKDNVGHTILFNAAYWGPFCEIIEALKNDITPEMLIDVWKQLDNPYNLGCAYQTKEKLEAYLEALKKADANARNTHLSDEEMAAIDGVGKEK